MAKSLSGLNIVLSATTAPFASAMKGAKASVSSFTSSVASAGSTVLKFTGIAGGIGAAFGALKSAASGISLAAELEQTSVAFETMLGSATAAQSMMQQLKSFAASTPFEFPELADAAKKLLAFGVAADGIEPALRSIGDIASGVGSNVGDLAEIYGKARTAGTLYAEDINQLVGRGIPVIREFAKQFGVPEAEIKKLASEGKISFANLEQAFQSLTSEGGQFAGLMQKQSGTLAGLWSTLKDNIGMSLASLTQKIIDAFRIKEGISALINATSTLGSWLEGAFARMMPPILNFGAMVWSVISGAFQTVYDYVAPIVSSIGSVIAETWRASVTSTVGYFTSIYNVVSAVFGAAWSIVKAVGSGIAAAWTWAMDLIGVKTDATGVTVAGTFSTIGEWARWLQNAITTAFNTVAYILNNIGATFELVGNEVALFFVRAGNEFTHGVGNIITLVKWFGTNFTSIVRDAFVASWTITKNGVTNIANVISNLPGLIAGTTDLSEVWTPLLDGFEATTSELPKLAARTAGPLEEALQQQADAAREAWGTGLADYLGAQAQQAKGITNGIASTIGGMMTPSIPAPTVEVPKVPAIEMPEIDSPEIDTSDATKGLDGIKDAAKGAADAVGLLESGSAKAMQLAAQAAFAATPKIEIPPPPKIDQQHPVVAPVAPMPVVAGGGIAGAALGAVSAAVEAAKPSMPVVTTPSVPELPRAATEGLTRAINIPAPMIGTPSIPSPSMPPVEGLTRAIDLAAPAAPSMPNIQGPKIGSPSMPQIPSVAVKADTSALDVARQQADRLLQTLTSINGLTVTPVVPQIAPSQQPQQIEQPQPTPLPRRTAEAVREGGSGGSKDGGGKDVLVAVVRDILREIRGADRIEFAEVR